jgi:O-antigen ligase
LIFVVTVLRYDQLRYPEPSRALWVPLLWLLIVATRNVSQWLDNLQTGLQPSEQFADYMQGSPIDRTVFLLLIIWGLVILFSRKVKWNELLKQNRILFFFLVYCGLSIIWSDYAAVSFKRWVKGLGDYVMVLVVLTETFPIESVKAIIRKCAIILVPFSLLLIRYFPYGRIFTPWGQGEYVGVATSKNMLGTLCLIFGLYLSWALLTKQLNREGSYDKKEIYGYLFYMLLIVWLLRYAPSVTSIACLVLGVFFLWVMKSSMMRRNVKYFGYILIYLVLIITVIQLSVDPVPSLLKYFGRDVTLTGRIPLWKQLLAMDINTFYGSGYESFWLGDRLKGIWEKHWWMPNQAHNGFIEIYLNLGWAGVLLMVGILYSTYKKCIKEIKINYEFGLLKITVLFIILVFSQFEAAFKGLHIMWFLLLLVSIEYTGVHGKADLSPESQVKVKTAV